MEKASALWFLSSHNGIRRAQSLYLPIPPCKQTRPSKGKNKGPNLLVPKVCNSSPPSKVGSVLWAGI